MFKALAQYVMRGRLQAIVIALIGSWVPFISLGVLGLVTLRRGWQEGLLVTMWASLPAFIALWMGQVATPMALASIAVYFVGYAASCTLRTTIAWHSAFIVSLCGAALSAVLIVSVIDDVSADFSAFFASLLQVPDGESAADIKQFIEGWTPIRAAGMIAYWVGLSSVVGLLLARWWQALLYNPGGFQKEFHHMRLPISVAVLSAILAAFGFSAGTQYEFWSGLLALPLLIASLGLAHWLLARFKLGKAAVVALYIALLLVPLSGLILMALALQDAVFGVRDKLRINQSDD